MAWQASAGKTPRLFALHDGDRQLLAVNEDSDTIVRFDRDPSTGTLNANKVVARCGSPTCILFGSINGPVGNG